jgi:hypothetical protein
MHAMGTWDPRAVGLGLLIGYGWAAHVLPGVVADRGVPPLWSLRRRQRARTERRQHRRPAPPGCSGYSPPAAATLWSS